MTHRPPSAPSEIPVAPAPTDVSDDAELAAALAAAAGTVLLEQRARADAGAFAGDQRALGDAGDAAAQARLSTGLAIARPGDAVLSEEARDDHRRLDADRVWIIDPLDGTREFSERVEDGRGWRDDFAVHVALWQRGQGLVAGAVALPARGRVLRADPGLATGAASAARTSAADAVLDGRRPLRLAVSRTRPPDIALRLGARPDVVLVPMGSTGVKVVAILDGSVDAYVHAGGQYEWDSAAPVAVAMAAGLVATRLDGSPLAFNQPDPWSPDLLVCHTRLVDHLRRLLAEAGPGARP